MGSAVNKDRLKIGQIGVGHTHGAAKMEALRHFSDIFEVVGVAEDDAFWKERHGKFDVYDGLPWMTEEELLNTPGLQAVLVEKDDHELVPAGNRCIDAGVHIH